MLDACDCVKGAFAGKTQNMEDRGRMTEDCCHLPSVLCPLEAGLSRAIALEAGKSAPEPL